MWLTQDYTYYDYSKRITSICLNSYGSPPPQQYSTVQAHNIIIAMAFQEQLWINRRGLIRGTSSTSVAIQYSSSNIMCMSTPAGWL